MAAVSDPGLKRVLRLLYQKKMLFAATAAVVCTLIVILSYLMPRTYEARSVIYIERGVLNELIKNVTVTSSLDEKLKALAVVIKSRTLIQKVLDDLGIKASADDLEGMINSFQERTQVSIEVNKSTRRDSDLFTISFMDSDPWMAKEFVNSLVRRYIEDKVSLHREEALGASKFLVDQISTFKGKLEKIETSIARQRKERNIPEQTLALYDQLEALRKKKNALLVQYTENHPDVAKASSEIEMLEAEIRSRSATGMPSVDQTLVELERERDTTKKIYEDLMATLRKSEVSSEMEVQDKAGAVKVLDPAVVPGKPLSPNMSRMILLALVAGIGAGLGIVVVRDSMDPSIKSPETIKKMNIPVLAVITTMRTEQESAAIRKKDGIIYAGAALYIAAVLSIAVLEAMGVTSITNFMQAAKADAGTAIKKILHRS